MNNKILIVFFSLLLSSSVFGSEYQVITYKVKAGDSFASILRDFVYPDSVINARTPMTKKTIANNPGDLDWNNLPAGREVSLYVDKKFLDMSKFAVYEKSRAPMILTPDKVLVAPTQVVVKDRWYKLIDSTFELGLKNESITIVRGVTKSETLKNEALNLKLGVETNAWGLYEFYPFLALNVGLSSAAQAALPPSFEFTLGAKRYWDQWTGFGTAVEVTVLKDSYIYFLNSTVANQGNLTSTRASVSLYKIFETSAFPVTVGGNIGHSIISSDTTSGTGAGPAGLSEMLWLKAPLWKLGNIKFEYSQWTLSTTGYELESKAYKTSIGINF